MNPSSSLTVCTKTALRQIVKSNKSKKQARLSSPPIVANKKGGTRGADGTSKSAVRKRARGLKLVLKSCQQKQKRLVLMCCHCSHKYEPFRSKKYPVSPETFNI